MSVTQNIIIYTLTCSICIGILSGSTKNYATESLTQMRLSSDGDTLLRHLTVTVDPKLEKVIAKRIELNKKRPTSGFRIQLYSGTNRTEAVELQIKFNMKYPDIEVYTTYQTPHYRLRIGDFSSREDAMKVRRTLERDFGSLIIVPDTLNPDKIDIDSETKL